MLGNQYLATAGRGVGGGGGLFFFLTIIAIAPAIRLRIGRLLSMTWPRGWSVRLQIRNEDCCMGSIPVTGRVFSFFFFFFILDKIILYFLFPYILSCFMIFFNLLLLLNSKFLAAETLRPVCKHLRPPTWVVHRMLSVVGWTLIIVPCLWSRTTSNRPIRNRIAGAPDILVRKENLHRRAPLVASLAIACSLHPNPATPLHICFS